MDVLSHLPKPDALQRLMVSLAVLDAILSPEWEYRYYSFDVGWGPDENMGSIRNGSGDDVFVLFNKMGCFMKGYSHEYQSENDYQDFYKNIPSEFEEASREPAFTIDNVSFCFWHKFAEKNWEYSVAPSSINSDVFFMLQDLSGDPNSYVEFGEDYYVQIIDPSVVAAIYDHSPVTESMARSLNADIDFQALQVEITKMGYPS